MLYGFSNKIIDLHNSKTFFGSMRNLKNIGATPWKPKIFVGYKD